MGAQPVAEEEGAWGLYHLVKEPNPRLFGYLGFVSLRINFI